MSVTQDHELASTLLTNQATGRIAWNKFIAQVPSPKQLAFLMLPHRHALFGGAAGGGKSSALIMGALQHVDVPYYSGIIFRKNLTDLKMGNDALLNRMFDWLSPYLGVDVGYEPSTHTFHWENRATIVFGYIGDATAWRRYQGSSYQYIGWDELTQHAEIHYDEMISRNRRNACMEHGGRILDGKPAPLPYDPSCDNCVRYAPLSMVPLRIRSTTNPGDTGAYWVKKRFGLTKTTDPVRVAAIRGWSLDQAKDYIKEGGRAWYSSKGDYPFIASFHTENPGLDQETYGKSLAQIKDEERRRELLEGDWAGSQQGRFKPQWFNRFYRWVNGYYAILAPSAAAGLSTSGDLAPTHSYHYSQILRFAVVDVACSKRTGVATDTFYQTGGNPLPASWTVIGVFGITPKAELLILQMIRFQEEAPEIFDAMRKMCHDWQPTSVAIEVNGPGKPIAQLAMQMGIPIREVLMYSDKIANSAEAQHRVRNGRVYLPEEPSMESGASGGEQSRISCLPLGQPSFNSSLAVAGVNNQSWVDDFIGELTTWKGHPHQVDDQVDVLSNAVHEMTRLAGNLDREGTFVLHSRDVPVVSSRNRYLIDMPYDSIQQGEPYVDLDVIASY